MLISLWLVVLSLVTDQVQLAGLISDLDRTENQKRTDPNGHEGALTCDQADSRSFRLATHFVRQFHEGFPETTDGKTSVPVDIILRNVEELTDGKRITSVLQFDGPFKDQIRQILMLEAFVNRPDWSASEQDIVKSLSRSGARRA